MDDNIHNWYERLVLKELEGDARLNDEFSDEAMSDIACLSLNNLPPKYVRHTVDMAFYTSAEELGEMNSKVRSAISSAIEYVRRNPGQPKAG